MSLSRSALLIGNPGEETSTKYCPGVLADMKRYETFFLSPLGGAWRKDEIKVFKQPTRNIVEQYIRLINTFDYAVIIFCGHGWHSNSQGSMIELNSSEDISVAKLREGASKQILILDSCRTKGPEVLQESMRKFAEFRTLDSQRSREYFDKHIEKCETGLILINSCAIGETAGENSSGGYFSFSLVEETKARIDRQEPNQAQPYVVDIAEAFRFAKDKVLVLSNERQHPEIEKGRRNYFFPFGILV